MSQVPPILKGENIVCFAGEDWWYHNPHSNKHLMQELARAGNRVLFVNNTGLRTPDLLRDLYAWKRIGRKLRSLSIFLRQPEPGLHVLTPFALPVTKHLRRLVVAVNQVMIVLQTRLICALLRMRQPIIWAAQPGITGGAIALRRRWAKLLAYYCVDNIAFLTGADTPFIQKLEAQLQAHADLILFSGRRLLKDRIGQYSAACLLSHGVEFRHFAQAQTRCAPMPGDLQGIPAPIVGYIGEIKALDVELLGALARRNPEISFVLIGRVMMDVSALRSLPNVHFLGKRPYAALPSYLQYFRCCAIFYRAGEPFNDYRSPKKLLEYFATGLPLVSTRLAELDPLASLAYQASTLAEFHHQLHRALSESDPELRRLRIEMAAKRDWSVVAAEASQHIARALAAATRKPIGSQMPQISS